MPGALTAQPRPRSSPISVCWSGGTAAQHSSQRQNMEHQSGIKISGWVGSSEFPLDANNLAEG